MKKTALEVSDEEFQRIVQTNLNALFAMSREVGKCMQTRKAGVIINISSAGGVSPAEGLGPYCISKAGINITAQSRMENCCHAKATQYGPDRKINQW